MRTQQQHQAAAGEWQAAATSTMLGSSTWRALTTVFCFLIPASIVSAEPPAWLDREWAEARLLNDGASEVCIYDSTTTLNARPCPYEMVTVWTKKWLSDATHVELDYPINRDLPVATAAAGGTRRAFRFNIISERIDTQTTQAGQTAYPYDYTSITYLDAADPAHCISAVATSHEWTGATVKRFRGWSDKPSLETMSTRGAGQADQEQPVEPGVIPLEAVPLLARMMKFDNPTTATFRCLPTFMVNRVMDLRILDLQAVVDGTETTSTAAGSFECNRVRVSTTDGKPIMTLWIEKPGTLRRLVYKTAVTGKQFGLKSYKMESLAEADTK